MDKNVDNTKYFYPASTVKLPAAVLALDKLRRYESLSIDKDTKLTINSDKTWMSSMLGDSSSENGEATIAQFIKKIFVVSDNDAFNRLYEFLGQDHFNQRMWDLGYSETRMRHRLSIPLTAEQNKYTNSLSFFINDKKILEQVSSYIQYLDSPMILLSNGLQHISIRRDRVNFKIVQNMINKCIH